MRGAVSAFCVFLQIDVTCHVSASYVLVLDITTSQWKQRVITVIFTSSSLLYLILACRRVTRVVASLSHSVISLASCIARVS